MASHVDDNGTTHDDFCWCGVLDQIDRNATDAGCTEAGTWGWLETDLIPEWNTTPGSLAATYLSDGTATCTCKD